MAPRVYRRARQLVSAHQAAGHTVVLMSPAPAVLVRPLATDLGIEHIIHPPEGPNGAATAVKSFAAAADIDVAQSCLYVHLGDDIELLSMMDTATMVNPSSPSATEISGAAVLRLRRHRHPIGTRILCTAAALGAFTVSAMVTMLRTAGQDQRSKIDMMSVEVSGAALRAAGVDIRIAGALETCSLRPGVFVYNHQSQLDALVIP